MTTQAFADDSLPRTFRHPSVVRLLAVSSMWLCAGSVLFFVALPFVSPGSMNPLLLVACILTLAVGFYVAVTVTRSSRERIVVEAGGLRCQSPGGHTVYIPWDEVASVEPENVMQRLLVTDRSGQRTIHLEFHLEDFGELRRIVLERSGVTATRS
jgi:hypothetical protein